MKISIVIPYHDIPQTAFFIGRLMKSIDEQTHKDYEIMLVKKGRMGETYNEGIKRSKGDVIKLMGMDDYFAHSDALRDIANVFENEGVYWAAAACKHDVEGVITYTHSPKWNDRLYEGYNTVGGFATISVRNKDIPELNEDLDWCIDIDWYWRLKSAHGLPALIEKPNVVVGVGPHQVTSNLSEQQKAREHSYMREKYENS